jgi:hypothetical protein
VAERTRIEEDAGCRFLFVLSICGIVTRYHTNSLILRFASLPEHGSSTDTVERRDSGMTYSILGNLSAGDLNMSTELRALEDGKCWVLSGARNPRDVRKKIARYIN